MGKYFIAGQLMTLILVFNVSASTDSTRIIYGEDNRKEISELNNEKHINLAKAVAAKIDKWSYNKRNLTTQNTIAFLEAPVLSDPYAFGVCKDERFANQPLISDCTGFLIGEDTLVTAGHCMADNDQTIKNKSNYHCRNNEWLFNFEMSADGKFDRKNVSADNIYKCKKIIIATLTDEDDYAVIKLDRKVKGVTPLKMHKKGKVKTNTPIFVIGHPSGLPKKFADGAKVRDNSKSEYFVTNLDTFGGNSGSPVINANTLEVEGILVRGKTDYIDSEDDREYCMRVNTCDNNAAKCKVEDADIDGEEVTRITEILQFIKK